MFLIPIYMVIYQFNRMKFVMHKGMKTVNCFSFYYLITIQHTSINSFFLPINKDSVLAKTGCDNCWVSSAILVMIHYTKEEACHFMLWPV